MSRINLIALVLLILGLVWMFTLGGESLENLRRVGLSMTTPMLRAKKGTSDLASRVSEPQLSRQQLEEANRRLLREVRQLRIEAQTLERLYEENARLRQALTLKKIPNFELVAAEVIGRDTATWYNTMVVDKGTDDGVAKNDPVIVDTGLVGKVALATEKSSVVLLLTDEACKVTARVIGTEERGILEGQGSRRANTRQRAAAQGELSGKRGGLSLNPVLRLRYLAKDATIQPGMSVFSSGQGSVFPPNLELGRVTSVMSGEITTEAEVEPSVDFSRLDFVFIVKSSPA